MTTTSIPRIFINKEGISQGILIIERTSNMTSFEIVDVVKINERAENLRMKEGCKVTIYSKNEGSKDQVEESDFNDSMVKLTEIVEKIIKFMEKKD